MADATKTVEVKAKFRDEASRSARRMSDNVSGSMKRMAVSAAAAVGGIAALKVGIADSIRASIQHSEVIQRFSNAVQGNRGAVDSTGRWAEQMQRLTGIQSDTILETVTLGKALGADLPRAIQFTEAALATAAATGKDFNSIHNNLTKTLGGSLGELAEMVPELKALSAEELKAGKAADFLLERYNGAIEEMASNTAVQMRAARESWHDLQQAIGDAIRGTESDTKNIVKILDSITGALNRMTEARRDMSEQFHQGQTDFSMIANLIPGPVGENLAKHLSGLEADIARLQGAPLRAPEEGPGPRLPLPGEAGFIGPLTAAQARWAELDASTGDNTDSNDENTDATDDNTTAVKSLRDTIVEELAQWRMGVGGAPVQVPVVGASDFTGAFEPRIPGSLRRDNLADIVERNRIRPGDPFEETRKDTEDFTQSFTASMGGMFNDLIFQSEAFGGRMEGIFAQLFSRLLGMAGSQLSGTVGGPIGALLGGIFGTSAIEPTNEVAFRELTRRMSTENRRGRLRGHA